MSGILIVGIWLLNIVISWLNAWSVGRSWADSRAVGGWPRFLVWCAAVMSACGFTWCYLVLIGVLGNAFGYLTDRNMELLFELGYVVIILPVLGSGLAIWMDSLTTAWRQRDAKSIGVAAWNTYAQAHNTYEAVSMLPGILEDLGEGSSSGDDDDGLGKVIVILIVLVVIAALGGILTTIAIVRSTARNYSHEVLDQEFRSRQRSAGVA